MPGRGAPVWRPSLFCGHFSVFPSPSALCPFPLAGKGRRPTVARLPGPLPLPPRRPPAARAGKTAGPAAGRAERLGRTVADNPPVRPESKQRHRRLVGTTPPPPENRCTAPDVGPHGGRDRPTQKASFPATTAASAAPPKSPFSHIFRGIAQVRLARRKATLSPPCALAQFQSPLFYTVIECFTNSSPFCFLCYNGKKVLSKSVDVDSSSIREEGQCEEEVRRDAGAVPRLDAVLHRLRGRPQRGN